MVHDAPLPDRLTRPPFVISIQSQVVFGHVGNSAALFPLQAAGIEVAAIPTVVFSNTPLYPTLRGRALDPGFFADLLLGAMERGLPERADFLLTGYIGSVEIAGMIADFVARAREINPRLIYLCDPVLGDAGPGLYVPAAIAGVIRDRLLPLADIATPNPFELSYLTGIPIRAIADLRHAAAALTLAPGARLIATGCALQDTPPGHIESVILQAGRISRHPTPQLPAALAGTGDLFAALILAASARGRKLEQAVEFAQAQTSRALRAAMDLDMDEVVLTDPDFLRAFNTLI